MLPIPIPIPNWKLATLELDIFTLATFTNSNSSLQLKHSKTQTPNENVPHKILIFRAARSVIAPYRIRYRTRGERRCNGKSHLVTFCASRPLTPSTRAGRLFAAWRATGKTKDATRFRRVGIPSRNVRLDKHGMEWNRPRNRCRHLRFFRIFGAQRRS